MATFNENARQAGADVTVLGGGVTQNKAILHCFRKCTKSFPIELANIFLVLSGVADLTQRTVMFETLQYLDEGGLNSFDGTKAHYARFVARIHELEELEIDFKPQSVLSSDGLVHSGMGRHVLIGRGKDMIDPHVRLDLEV